MARFIIQVALLRMPSLRGAPLQQAYASTPFEAEDGQPALEGAALRLPGLMDRLLHPPGTEREFEVTDGIDPPLLWSLVQKELRRQRQESEPDRRFIAQLEQQADVLLTQLPPVPDE